MARAQLGTQQLLYLDEAPSSFVEYPDERPGKPQTGWSRPSGDATHGGRGHAWCATGNTAIPGNVRRCRNGQSTIGLLQEAVRRRRRSMRARTCAARQGARRGLTIVGTGLGIGRIGGAMTEHGATAGAGRNDSDRAIILAALIEGAALFALVIASDLDRWYGQRQRQGQEAT